MKFRGYYEEEYNEDILKISTDIFSFLVFFSSNSQPFSAPVRRGQIHLRKQKEERSPNEIRGGRIKPF